MKYAETGLVCDSIIDAKNKQIQISENVVHAYANDLQVTKKKLKWSVFGLGAVSILAIVFIIL